MRATTVEKPPISRFALVAIASNTGCTSSGELAMTLRMSAVAVWRSSDSLVSLKRRTFSSATPMLETIVCSSLISLGPNACSRSKLSTTTTPTTRSAATIFTVSDDSEHSVPGATPAAATSAAVLRTMTLRSEVTSFQRASDARTGAIVTRLPCSIS